MQAENNNDIAITEAKLKDFLSSVLSSEGIVVDIRRTFIEYNGVNRSRVFARHANRMACKGSNEKFVVIALLCYPALQWLLKAQDIDALIEKLKEENEDESVWRMSNIQRILESSMGGCKPQLRLEMRKLFFARCQQLVDEIDEAMNKAVFMNKKNIALILGAVMTASVMLAGCGKKVDVPATDSTVSSSATGETATGESATPETSTETVTVDYGVGLKKNGYFKGVKAKKLVTLPADYANIQIPRDELDLKDIDASVASTISQITSSYGDRVKVERSAQAGDEVIVDYEGTYNGERFTGSTAGDSKIVIGAGYFVSGFEDQLIGHFAGEVFDITVTFPDEYPATTDLEGNEIALAGQDVVFRITLKEVDEIKLTDQNVKDNIATQDGFVLSDGSAVDTVEKLKQYYTETYERDSLKTAVYSYIIDNTTVGEIPQSILDDQRESYRQEIKAIAASYNISEEEYLQQVGAESEDALLDTYNDQIKNSVTSLLIFQAIAEEQHIKVTDADVNAYFGNDELSVKQAKSYYGEEFLNQSVLFDKVYTWLVDHASIV